MQYPQIQFYRGSLVRLASGKLKQVEDLNSDDFLESARLAETSKLAQQQSSSSNNGNNHNNNNNNNNNNHPANNLPRNFTKRALQCAGRSLLANNNYNNNNHYQSSVDENNNQTINSSVFNSPELTPSFDSPTMEMMDTDFEMSLSNGRGGPNSNSNQSNELEVDDDDEELDVVTSNDDQDFAAQLNNLHNNNNNLHNARLQPPVGQSQTLVAKTTPFQAQTNNAQLDEDLYIDSSVVRDFLEVGPPSSASPKSPNQNQHPSTSSLSSSALCSPSCQSPTLTNPTVLIKFFLESSRSIVFIEVPIEHPFFVFHRGWSSWNPQRTYDKFGLKCRKLKIGDTCISLIRRQHQIKQQQPQTKQQESDQCNILFSSIKINE